MITGPLKSLLYSRAFMLALLDLVQILVLNYLGLPDDIWKAIHALLMVVIAKMAIEDGAAKLGLSYKQ